MNEPEAPRTGPESGRDGHRPATDVETPTDLVKYALHWSADLDERTVPADRIAAYEAASEIATRCIFDEAPGAADLVRTVLRRLAADIASNQIATPLPEGAEELVQKLISWLLHQESEALAVLNEGSHAGTDPIDLVRRSPRDAGTLRALGRLLRDFQGTGLLSFANQATAASLIDFDRELRSASRRTVGSVPDHLRISRERLLQWANTGAGYDLPALVRRLILETVKDLKRLHFPAGSGAATGGWDGTAQSDQGNAFVPQGLSAWELSVSQDSQSKAEDDYSKRTQGPDGTKTADVTYVQVICRPWTKASEFVASHRADGRWNDVRALNVDDLETWLESAPATTVWMAEKLGEPVHGISSADTWRARWEQSTTVPLEPSMVVAGREQQVQALVARVQSPGVTTVGGDVRLEEILAFVAAATADAGDGTIALGPRVLFLTDTADAKGLANRPGELVLVTPNQQFMHDVQSTSGHHFLVPVVGSDRADLVLPPVSSKAFADALETTGMLSSKARETGALARRSLLAARRQLALKPDLHRPTWADPGADAVRRRGLLVGSWNQTASGDTSVVAEFLGQPYQTIENALRVLAASPEDPMFAVVDQRWHVVSPMDAWLLLANQLTVSDLEGFRVLLLKVLLEPDPVQSLAVEDKWRAALDGVRHQYSSDLIRGLARSLALLGAVGHLVEAGSGITGQNVANSIVREVLEAATTDDSTQAWNQIAPHLPLLAEAAPEIVLTHIRQSIDEGRLGAEQIFSDSARSSFGTPDPSAHTHFLWAMETLVWSTEYFDSAVSVIARMADIDPGGEWSNRPGASLASVFSPWHPNTSAGEDQRTSTLNRLRKQHPATTWKLLMSMLPSSTGFQMVHEEPRYRDWKRSEPVVTQAEFSRMVHFAADALLEDVGDSAERWVELIKQLNNLPAEHRARAREQLGHVSLEADPKAVVWTELRDFIAHHRTYSDAKWALTEDEVNGFVEVANAMAPDAPQDKHAWLFESGRIDLDETKYRRDHAAYDSELLRRRTSAVTEMLESGGLDAVVDFATDVALPGAVGVGLAKASEDQHREPLLKMLAKTDEAQSALAFSYFSVRFADEGWPWLDGLLAQNPDPKSAARLLNSTRDPVVASAKADSVGGDTAACYWEEFSYFGLGHDFDGVVGIAKKLIANGRAAAALDLLGIYSPQSIDVDYAETATQAFEALMVTPTDKDLDRLSQYQVQGLLRILAQRYDTIDRARVVAIEWYFLPMLGFDPDAQILHREMADDPEFFVSILKMVFKPDEGEIAELSEEERRAAENAFRLLTSWSRCPGTNEAGSVELAPLRKWVADARRLLSNSSRAVIGDQQIGQALAAAPADDDELWPCVAVRDLLEELQNDQIERGLEIRVRNDRGVTSRSLDEGGQQEWKLGEHHANMAGRLNDSWPRSAAIHRQLAAGFEAEARHEDTKAERFRRGLDR